MCCNSPLIASCCCDQESRIAEAKLIFAEGSALSAEELAAMDAEGSVRRCRSYWGEEFGDEYEAMASDAGVGPAALMMV